MRLLTLILGLALYWAFSWALSWSLAETESGLVLLKPDQTVTDPAQLDHAARIIERRLVAAGLTNGVDVKVVPAQGIFVQMLGLSRDDRDRIMQLVKQRGQVEFRIVIQGREDPLSTDDLEPATLTGSIISRTSSSLASSTSTPVVFLDFHADHQAAFGDLTGENIGRRLAIVLDGEVLTAPLLQARITDGAQISGFDSLEDANRIAILLRNEALPFGIDAVEPVTR